MILKKLGTVIPLSIFLILTVTLVTGIAWVGGSTYDAVLENQSKAMQGLVQGTMNALDDYAEQIKVQARIFAKQQNIIDALEGETGAADHFFKNVLETNSGIWAALVFDDRGKVISGGSAGSSLVGEDLSQRGYVKAILGGEDLEFSPEILIPKGGNDTYIFAVAAAVKDSNGRILGGVGLFPSWQRFTATHLDTHRIGQDGYGFMIDAGGKIIAHAVNKDLMLKDLSKQGFIQTVLEQKQGEAEYDWEGRAKRMAFATLPETGWAVVMSAYEDDLAATAIAQRNVLGIGGIIALALLTAILVVLLRSMIFSPMNHILDFAGRIADGDLKAELHGKYHFELAILADKIKIMVAELKTKLGFAEGVLDGLTLPCAIVGPDFNMLWVNKLACELMEHGGEPKSYVGMKSGEFFYRDGSRESLADKAIKSGEASEQEIVYTAPSGRQRNISVSTTPFNDMDGVLLGSLSLWVDLTEIRTQQKQIEKQNERIAVAAEKADEVSQYLSTAAEELSAQIEEASRGSDIQRDRAAETATAMEEMNATVLEVAQNAGSASDDADRAKATAEEGASVVSDVIAAIGDVQSKAQDLRASMEELGQQAESIGTVMNVITDIADQTNLLALNAAIEAARAGDAGRGFAVVADEVRKLAEKTMQATKEVGDAINAMQSAAGANVKATESAAESVSRSTELAERSGETLQEIVRLVDNVADQVRSIATAAEQQSATSDEINRATEEINRVASESAEVMTQSSEAVHEVARMATNLGEIITEMAASS